MKILFDQNLSPHLVNRPADIYPGSQHVQAAGLDSADDQALWTYACNGGFVILTKDEDFNDLAMIRGCPPKVLWLQLGNCTTAQVEAAIRLHKSEIEDFVADANAGTFVLR